MKILFYAPFKPLDHPDPSGDRAIGSGVVDFLKQRGHGVETASRIRSRWIYWKPWQIPALLKEKKRVRRRVARNSPDLWLTYHSYYKAPDLLGPSISRRHGLPYVIFQGIYATKRRKRLLTWPGFRLNRTALLSARHVFANKRVDFENLKRLIPPDRLTYVAPGIDTAAFRFDEKAGNLLRGKWGVGEDPVILAAAMFRSDVKTQGLMWLIRACEKIFQTGLRFYLVIAGDGREKDRIRALADTCLPGRVRFAGKIPRDRMAGFYSAGDLFAFPGIRESLGMVFLEAQACGLPVVAFDNGGIPEVVEHQRTGFLVPPYAVDDFNRAVKQLLQDRARRQKMGRAARDHIHRRHDVNRNYLQMAQRLEGIANVP